MTTNTESQLLTAWALYDHKTVSNKCTRMLSNGVRRLQGALRACFATALGVIEKVSEG